MVAGPMFRADTLLSHARVGMSSTFAVTAKMPDMSATANTRYSEMPHMGQNGQMPQTGQTGAKAPIRPIRTFRPYSPFGAAIQSNFDASAL